MSFELENPTDTELLEFYKNNKNEVIELRFKSICTDADHVLTLEQLFKMFKLVMEQEANETKDCV